ncbi:MAG: hypothetical protein HC833_06795 [Leptolyngbyaceae cyanobacterium RM1_406_9]|nr:hypothetical protein [Leptolyngbyaceae cyanobacterium RM1_406_9]
MRRFNPFTLIYLAAATVFVVIWLSLTSIGAAVAAGFALTLTVCSLFPWWQRTIVDMGKKGNYVVDAIGILVPLGIQIYGLLSDELGLSYFLIGFAIVMLISTIEDVVVLNQAERAQGRV